MPLHEYPITLSNPDLLTPEIVERVFAVTQKQGVVCLSDIKRELTLKYDVIRAALYFLESSRLIIVMKEEAKRFGINGQQTPVKVTSKGRRISLIEVGRMLDEQLVKRGEKVLKAACGTFVHNPT